MSGSLWNKGNSRVRLCPFGSGGFVFSPLRLLVCFGRFGSTCLGAAASDLRWTRFFCCRDAAGGRGSGRWTGEERIAEGDGMTMSAEDINGGEARWAPASIDR